MNFINGANVDPAGPSVLCTIDVASPKDVGSRGFSYRRSDQALIIAPGGTVASSQGGFGFTSTGALATVTGPGVDAYMGLTFDFAGRLAMITGGVVSSSVAGWPMSGPRVNATIVA